MTTEELLGRAVEGLSIAIERRNRADTQQAAALISMAASLLIIAKKMK